MKNETKDKIIEEWMKNEYSEMSDIRDLELAEGVSFVNKLGRLLDITEENLTKHNSQKNQSANMGELVEDYIVNEISKGKKHKIGRLNAD